MLSIDCTFPANYKLEPGTSILGQTGTEKQVYIPPSPEEDKVIRLGLRVVPRAGTPWVGLFAREFAGDQALNGAWHSADPDCFCVVAGGATYLTHAEHPLRSLRLKYVVCRIRPILNLGLLVMCDYQHVFALSGTKMVWESDVVSWDGIRFSEVRGSNLHGLGWEPMTDKEVPFTIDLLTGKHCGGAMPRFIKA